MAVIVLDLDDVLANLRETLYRVLLTATGVDLPWRQWPHYDLRKLYAIEEIPLQALLKRERALESCEPEPGAAAATRALRAQGYQVRIITARGWHPDAERLTRHWLAQHGIEHDTLAVVPLTGDKVAMIEDRSQVVLAVDDHPRYIDGYRQAGIPAVVVDRPWNGHCTAERVHSLEALVEIAVKYRAVG